MAINFPNNPALNQTYSNGTTTWKWNGAVWELSQNSEVSFNRIIANDADIVDLTVTNSVSGINFNQLDDVLINNLQNNQTIYWNSSISKWINASAFNGGTITNALSIQNSLTVSNNVSIQNQRELRLFNAINSRYVGFAAPNNPTVDKIYKLPASDGSNGQYLRTDGSGNLTWASVVSPSGATPAQGTSGSIQFNDNNEFAGVSTLVYDSVQDELTVPQLTATGIVEIEDVTESSSASTGALIVDGGVGIAKNLNVSGAVRSSNNTGSTSTTTGAVIIDGGVGIAENVYVGGIVDSNDVPTAVSHLTNKQYVDNRVTAFAVAFGT